MIVQKFNCTLLLAGLQKKVSGRTIFTEIIIFTSGLLAPHATLGFRALPKFESSIKVKNTHEANTLSFTAIYCLL